jgi:hypothetical protein
MRNPERAAWLDAWHQSARSRQKHSVAGPMRAPPPRRNATVWVVSNARVIYLLPREERLGDSCDRRRQEVFAVDRRFLRLRRSRNGTSAQAYTPFGALALLLASVGRLDRCPISNATTTVHLGDSRTSRQFSRCICGIHVACSYNLPRQTK